METDDETPSSPMATDKIQIPAEKNPRTAPSKKTKTKTKKKHNTRKERSVVVIEEAPQKDVLPDSPNEMIDIVPERLNVTMEVVHENPNKELSVRVIEEAPHKNDLTDSPNEMIDIVPERLNVTMEVIHEDPNKVAPIVGYFPSGFNPSRDEEEDGGDVREPPLKVRVFRNTRKQGRLQLVVSPNDSNVDFVGTNYSGEAAYPQVCTYALGVLDKEAGSLKIVPIASNKIFRLDPRVGGSNISDAEPLAVINEERTIDRINKLTARYGTKRSITEAKKRESLKQNANPGTEKDSGMELVGLVANKDALESTSSHASRNIPPHNSSATTPQMAYPLDNIIGKGEWKFLLDILELFEGGAEVSSTNYPSFVCNRISKLNDIEDVKEKQQLACIFSYITHLIKFKDQHSMDGVNSAKHHKIPGILLQKFSSTFADPGSKWLTNEKNDLLISYILVLTLFADEFQTDPSDIGRDLRMTTLTLRKHYQHLGCKLVHKRTSPSFATLPVPLEFPKLRNRSRR